MPFIKEFGIAEWIAVAVFSMIHPVSILAAVLVAISGLSGWFAFLLFLALSMFGLVLMLRRRHDDWIKGSTRPAKDFLVPALLSYLYYLPLVAIILINMLELVPAIQRNEGGAGDFIAFGPMIVGPPFLLLMLMSKATFHWSLKRKITPKPAPSPTPVDPEKAKRVRTRQDKVLGLLALLFIVFLVTSLILGFIHSRQ